MKYYTVWYWWKNNQKVIWATGLTREQAEMAIATIVEEFGLTAGMEEE